MLTISKIKFEDFINAFDGKESITEDELQKVVKSKNYMVFEGEVILHLLEGVLLIPMNGHDIMIQQTKMTTDGHIQDKKEFVEQHQQKMKVYEYILQNQTEYFQMKVEEKVTFDELEKWYDAFFRKHRRGPVDSELEEYRNEDGVRLDVKHSESNALYAYFFIRDGVVEMRYEVKNDEKCYEWAPVLIKDNYLSILEVQLERERSKEGIKTLTYILEYFKKKSQ